ncbi:hypothetical protein MKL09_16680 [Methylobacterium sp. J-048]|uniref:hypothetical protein n=1 Tax=unclassified Methylobacterium TaxID=2615210 RepID=UPI001FBB763A|nr:MULTISPECIES: hypothetical protein [unclassified Methylobacterium]MCJ2058186.1 hypothetical protein [Methylobacterium sp. J-048]MCJ2142223.1 hypothetical protein [Methylobacterium sp. E-066]
MRYILMPVLLIATATAPRADDLADLPELACALASTPLELQQIGCPGYTSLSTAQPPEKAVRFEQSGETSND